MEGLFKASKRSGRLQKKAEELLFHQKHGYFLQAQTFLESLGRPFLTEMMICVCLICLRSRPSAITPSQRFAAICRRPHCLCDLLRLVRCRQLEPQGMQNWPVEQTLWWVFTFYQLKVRRPRFRSIHGPIVRHSSSMG
ncbi:hypothetical protein MPTK1_2g14420 [Marchantia polymorpha subsp. ruderalis]|uniref:Uncharacterized protein n=1 Tax=Marchantia polymorpha TaxID=3197 RepID=A0A2R6X1S7_MARPO|nr:hypothetical protein MARPO_0042s0069 [Marchantia polymorpha]BBN02332.1 hypothetical protein Mp_2g14420 [Marchantia polymorpha subsp. ruderalis]|eukprot:PTQ40031.1 hypothetical protein MARPO_0042s0069 [Marchantia polymorpha]